MKKDNGKSRISSITKEEYEVKIDNLKRSKPKQNPMLSDDE